MYRVPSKDKKVGGKTQVCRDGGGSCDYSDIHVMADTEREREIYSHSVAAYTRRKTPGKKNTHIQTSKCVSVSVCLFPFLFFIFLPSLRHDTRQTHSVKGHGTYGALLLLLLLLLLFLLLPASNTPPAYTCLSASISRFSSHILHFISHTAHSLLMFLSLSLCL